MKTSFDFISHDSEYIYNINSHIILHITRINNGVALLYFTDEDSNKINIPNNIIVYTYDFQDNNKQILLKPIKENYALCWTDNYIIELDKNVLINIKNQRKWNIIS